jgi:hypothetical protein
MDKKVLDLQRQLLAKDLIIQNLKTKLDQLQEFKNQVSLAFQKSTLENEPASVQARLQHPAEEETLYTVECRICLLEVIGKQN